MIRDYIEEINAFEVWLETNYLAASSQLLWYKLMALCNKCGWAEWITVDNQRLMVYIQARTEKTLIAVRKNLIDSKLIEYKKGGKGCSNKYKMLSIVETKIMKTTKVVINCRDPK